MKKAKSALKKVGIGLGVCIGAGVLYLAYVGLGNYFIEEYNDPDNCLWNVQHSARYGWSLKLRDGWAA